MTPPVDSRPSSTMAGFPLDPALIQALPSEKKSFSSIPTRQKGPGKRARSANPGQWRRSRFVPGDRDRAPKIMGPSSGTPAIRLKGIPGSPS